MQSTNIGNTVELNKIFFKNSPEAEFAFNQSLTLNLLTINEKIE